MEAANVLMIDAAAQKEASPPYQVISGDIPYYG
jgi:hypothetical protein